jgi:hypothetical protein
MRSVAKSRNTDGPTMVQSLIDTIGDTILGLLSRCKSTDPSQINIIIHSFSCFTTTLQTLLNNFKVFSLRNTKHTKHLKKNNNKDNIEVSRMEMQ